MHPTLQQGMLELFLLFFADHSLALLSSTVTGLENPLCSVVIRKKTARHSLRLLLTLSSKDSDAFNMHQVI